MKKLDREITLQGRALAFLSILLVALCAGAWTIKDTTTSVDIYSGANTTPTISAATSGAVTLGPVGFTGTNSFNASSTVINTPTATTSYLSFNKNAVQQGYIGQQHTSNALITNGATAGDFVVVGNSGIAFSADNGVNQHARISSTGAVTLGLASGVNNIVNGTLRVGTSNVATPLGRITMSGPASTDTVMIHQVIASTVNWGLGVDSSNFFTMGTLSGLDTWLVKALRIDTGGGVNLGTNVSESTASSSSGVAGLLNIHGTNTTNDYSYTGGVGIANDTDRSAHIQFRNYPGAGATTPRANLTMNWNTSSFAAIGVSTTPSMIFGVTSGANAVKGLIDTTYGSMSSGGAWTFGSGTQQHQMWGYLYFPTAAAGRPNIGANWSSNSTWGIGPATASADNYVAIGTANAGTAWTTNTTNLTIGGCYKAGTAYPGATLVGGSCSSDARLKKDVESITGDLAKITALRPVTYHWINPVSGTDLQTGLIAQEVQTVYPELVDTHEDGMLAVRYGNDISMHLIEAVKELKADLDATKADYAAYKAAHP